MLEPMELTGKTFIITGANSGIGFAAARQMAKAGATVVMASRSLERGTAALNEIVHLTGSQRVHLLQVDMASMPSIHGFVESFLARFDRLDGLVNNAANFDISKTTPSFTESGAECIFATNHLGPFLLTNLLLDILKASAPSRVVNISSKGLLLYPFLKIQFDDLTTSRKRKYSPSYAYYHSKLAHIMFTRELARRSGGQRSNRECDPRAECQDRCQPISRCTSRTVEDVRPQAAQRHHTRPNGSHILESGG
jgi:NAD(P)-dependent dehydrogenase (short-subunit alcohol dehydrogenase family)